MGMPKKGSRLFVFEGTSLRWRVQYDGGHWAKGLGTPIRIVIEAAERAGQRLVADFTGWHRYPADHPLGEPFTPGFVRRLVVAGLAKGWRPDQQGLPPIELAHADVVAASPQGTEPGVAPDPRQQPGPGSS
jgi:hypothetical protein